MQAREYKKSRHLIVKLDKSLGSLKLHNSKTHKTIKALKQEHKALSWGWKKIMVQFGNKKNAYTTLYLRSNDKVSGTIVKLGKNSIALKNFQNKIVRVTLKDLSIKQMMQYLKEGNKSHYFYGILYFYQDDHKARDYFEKYQTENKLLAPEMYSLKQN